MFKNFQVLFFLLLKEKRCIDVKMILWNMGASCFVTVYCNHLYGIPYAYLNYQR